MANLLIVVNDIKEWNNIINYKDMKCNKEDFDYCIYRERYQEIESALKIIGCVYVIMNEYKNWYIYYKNKELEERFSWVYDGRNFVRGGINRINTLRKNLTDNFKNKKLTPTDHLIMHNWVHYLGQLTNRTIITVNNYQRGIFNLLEIKEPFFIKTRKKHMHAIGNNDDLLENNIPYIIEQSNFIVSDFMNIKKDKHGTMEYRIFVIDKKIVGISRYKDYEHIKIPKKIKYYANNLIKKIPYNHYCMDLCIKTDNTIDIVEFNDIASSGRYCDIKADDFIKAIKEL